MAGAGKKTFTAGETLTASDVNTYLMEQSVMNFGGTAARSSAIPTPSQGMVTYLDDTDAIEAYDGTNWVRKVPKVSPFAYSAGNLANTSLAQNGSANTTVTFPAGRFTQAPIIVANAAGEVAAQVVGYAAIPTTTSFILVRFNFYAGTQNVSATWIAIQMTSASGSG
jgi:hypothetical protein